MIRFEERLTRHLATLSALALLGTGCETTDLQQMCDGEDGPDANYFLALGYVTVGVGEDCPAVEDAALKVDPCNSDEWQGVVCGLDHKDENQVRIDDGYGGYWTDAGNTPTGGTSGGYGQVIEGPSDVCFFEGVFWDDPESDVTCGRPLLQDGAAIVAQVRRDDAWTRALDEVTLSALDRDALAAWWLGAARMEHASVASFAVVSLDLLRLGAPPELLADTHRAALDEIEHARLCFALASRYAGDDLGPAPMPDLAPSPAGSLADFAEALFREGCIGETLAAVDAAARLTVARDPAVRAALETIVGDESDHAALAWRTLRWVLRQDADGAVQTRLTNVLAEERARWSAPDGVAGQRSASALAHGLIPDDTRARELARAFAEVVEPSWAALA
jgi:hypothetical protein